MNSFTMVGNEFDLMIDRFGTSLEDRDLELFYQSKLGMIQEYFKWVKNLFFAVGGLFVSVAAAIIAHLSQSSEIIFLGLFFLVVFFVALLSVVIIVVVTEWRSLDSKSMTTFQVQSEMFNRFIAAKIRLSNLKGLGSPDMSVNDKLTASPKAAQLNTIPNPENNSELNPQSRRADTTLSGNDPRLRIIEFVGLMTGLLAVLVGFEKILPEEDVYLLVLFFVGLTIVGIVLYGSIITGYRKANVKWGTAVFSAFFSMVVAITLYGAIVGYLETAMNGGGLVVSVLSFLAVTVIVFFLMYLAFNRIMERATSM